MTRRAAADRPGRLAAERVPHPRRASRSSAGPTSPPTTATAGPASPTCCAASTRPGPRAARRSERSAARHRCGHLRTLCGGSRRRAMRPPGAPRPRRARWPSSPRASTRAGAASAPRPSSRRTGPSPCCCASTRAAASPYRCAWPSARSTRMALGGMYDQFGGGFARYSDRRALARPPLREDALRPGAARAPSTSTPGS